MPSTVEKLNPTRVKLTIEMPFAELQPSIEKAYAEIAQQVKLPGFRKGHVPNALIDQRFGRGAVLQEADQRCPAQRLRRGGRRAQPDPARSARGRGHQARGR